MLVSEKNIALTFDDISLVPSYSEVLPNETSLSHPLCKGLVLNMPIISAAMDTVTENKIAQTMAQRGGFGVIHKNMSTNSQAREVEKVKKYETGMILNPITLSPESLLQEAHELMNQFSFSGVPITQRWQIAGNHYKQGPSF